MFGVYLLFITAFCSCTSALPATHVKTVCEYFNRNHCQNGNGQCNGTEICPDPEEENKRSHCYAFWTNVSGEVEVVMKGCWLDYLPCYNRATCVEDNPFKDKFFCCCEGDFCNSILHLTDASLATTLASPQVMSSDTPTGLPLGGARIINVVLISLVPMLAVAVIVILVFWMWRHWIQRRYVNQSPSETPALLPKSLESVRDISLLELKARGRFSAVWKARYADVGFVAVKIYSEHDQQSWITETNFYSQPIIADHQNILQFIGCETRGSDIWLITEYHELGSLYDYLKCNTVTLSELINMATSMCAGLAFLHSSSDTKPPVAHRDIKSRNVLLRRDMTACIADFGLALAFSNQPGDVHGQVGTNRYMAPEILDGSINFSIECFLKIDVYACALVLWELLSRCTASKEVVSNYAMPFEDVVGLHPSLEDMQDVVVNRKQRPVLKESWYQDQHLATLCTTIEESWDQDPEARLSAECIDARLAVLEESLMSSSFKFPSRQGSLSSQSKPCSEAGVSASKINIVNKADVSSTLSTKIDDFASQISVNKTDAAGVTSDDKTNRTSQYFSDDCSNVTS